MRPDSGRAPAAPFRIFFVAFLGGALCAPGAFAQPGAKSGPMQSGVHTQKTPGAAPQPRPAQPSEKMDVATLFATSCGWCHSSGGREAGKGPKLMGTTLTDDELASRIRNGKTGQMPAFRGAFTERQIRDIVAYIRGLRPQK